MPQQAVIQDTSVTRKAGFLKRFLNFWMPVFDIEHYLSIWADDHLIPIDAQMLQNMSAEAYEKERRFYFQRAHSGLIGEYASPFKGQGMDFSELREYAPGDDIRKLDWQVFARTQVPHIREYREERQLTVWLVLQDSTALGLGPATYRYQADALNSLPLSDKRLRTYELLLRLSRIAKNINAKIGFFLATPSGYTVLKPATGQPQLIRISQLLFSFQLDENSSIPWIKTKQPFSALQNLVLKQDWVLAVTDASCINVDWVKPFGQISRHSPINIFSIQDKREWQIPKALEGMPLVSPTAPNLKAKLPIQAFSMESSDHSLLNLNNPVIKNVASIFPVDVSTSIDELLHQWASHLRTPFKTHHYPTSTGGIS